MNRFPDEYRKYENGEVGDTGFRRLRGRRQAVTDEENNQWVDGPQNFHASSMRPIIKPTIEKNKGSTVGNKGRLKWGIRFSEHVEFKFGWRYKG